MCVFWNTYQCWISFKYLFWFTSFVTNGQPGSVEFVRMYPSIIMGPGYIPEDLVRFVFKGGEWKLPGGSPLTPPTK